MKTLLKSLCFLSLVFFLFLSQGKSLNPVTAAAVLFVSTSGNDGNSCLDPLFPCATIQGAIGKAISGDTIKVATGTYTGFGDQVVRVDRNLQLSGGWDPLFTTQNGASTVDGQGSRFVMLIDGGVTLTLNYFNLQNGITGIVNNGNLTANYVQVRNNHGASSCWGGGIANYATMLLQWSTVDGNDCASGGYGGGIYNWQYGGTLTILNSTISNNQAATGAGIYNHNSLTVVNSTISNNTATFGFSNSQGGGIFNDGSNLILKNSTISDNDGALSGGGIYFNNTYGGNVTLSNSVLSINIANSGNDCSGSISSAGYNLISDTGECNFSSTDGDQLDVDAGLGELQDNGGPTFTHWLNEGSPAIDGGNPAGCTDQNGTIMTADQRGFIRPLDGDKDGNNVCDIGAFEADPDDLPPPLPVTTWYVTPDGNDINNCLAPLSACKTINSAIGKASKGDSVFVSIGTYTASSGNEVILIEKDLTLSGGWDTTFTTHNNLSTVDGQDFQRGITVNQEISATIEQFNLQNGRSPYADIPGYGGGGLYIGFRSTVTLNVMLIQANIAGSDNPSIQSSPYGGGIAMSDESSLTINDSWIFGNGAYDSGGGVHCSRGTLTINNSTIESNISEEGGGVTGKYGGLIQLNNSVVIYNESFGSSRGGGGIKSRDVDLVINNSLVEGNVAAYEGGGLNGTTMTIRNSSISNNEAKAGGGIRSWYTVEISNSAVNNNRATSGFGGGIFSGGDLVLINSTIANNSAENATFGSQGGGIYRAGGFIQASNVTISGNRANSGGGIMNQSAPVTLRNSLIAGNQAATGADCTGTITTNGYNLIGDTTGCSFSPATGDLTNIDARIANLYGWPAVMALWADSPAIDAGNPVGCIDHLGNTITFDQIGTNRPLDGNRDGDNFCDIGAYEYDPDHAPQWVFLPVITR